MVQWGNQYAAFWHISNIELYVNLKCTSTLLQYDSRTDTYKMHTNNANRSSQSEP